MGEHVYAYRGGGGHSNYGGDQACRTVVYDSDGRKRTVVGCSPYDTECYVVETEVTERIVGGSPLVTDSAYRYGSPPKKAVDPARDYGSYGTYEKYRGPASPYSDHRRPRDVDHFLNGVQIEASRPPPQTARRYSPSNGAVRPATHSTPGYYGDPYKNRSSGGYGGYSSSSDDDDYDRDEEAAYYKKPGHRVRPEPNLKVGNGRGGGGGKWAVAPASTHPTTAAAAANSNLSLPTNNIDDALDFLIGGGGGGGTRAYTSTETHVDHPPPSYGYNSNSKLNSGGGSEAARRPYGYNSSAKGGGGLESTAAVKPYGAKSNQTASYPTGSTTTTTTTGSHGAVIDCYEAARRYNGKVVRT